MRYEESACMQAVLARAYNRPLAVRIAPSHLLPITVAVKLSEGDEEAIAGLVLRREERTALRLVYEMRRIKGLQLAHGDA